MLNDLQIGDTGGEIKTVISCGKLRLGVAMINASRHNGESFIY